MILPALRDLIALEINCIAWIRFLSSLEMKIKVCEGRRCACMGESGTFFRWPLDSSSMFQNDRERSVIVRMFHQAVKRLFVPLERH
jgi:hypothetical protein